MFLIKELCQREQIFLSLVLKTQLHSKRNVLSFSKTKVVAT